MYLSMYISIYLFVCLSDICLSLILYCNVCGIDRKEQHIRQLFILLGKYDIQRSDLNANQLFQILKMTLYVNLLKQTKMR